MDIFFIITGFLFIVVAFFANLLGIDNDPGWGASRVMMLLFGAVISGPALTVRFLKARHPSTLQRITRQMLLPVIRSDIPTLAGIVLIVVGLSVFSFWFASTGNFPDFPKIGNLYLSLSQAFLDGQVSLPDTPDPRLQSMSGVREISLNETVPFLWDASYYQGKYYIYWGPVPALIFAVIELVIQTQPPDQLMVILSFIGLQILLAIMLWNFRKQWFPDAPGISVILFLIACALNLPALFMLVRPHQYETSILTGQFFLFLGLWFWYLARVKGRPAWLVGAGLSWGLAVGCRYNLALSVAVFSLFVLVGYWKEHQWGRIFVRRALLLLIPLALCALALGWYNFARFENPLETGLRYQLTVAVPEQYFSVQYLSGNVYQYLFYPHHPAGEFPVIAFIPLDTIQVPNWATIVPGMMYDRALFGFFPTLPVFWLPGLGLLCLPWMLAVRNRQAKREPPAVCPAGPGPWTWMLLAAGLIQFLFVMLYYFAAMRFVADFYWLLLLPVFFLVWDLDRRLQKLLWIRILLWGIVALACLWTAVIGFFGAFSAPPIMFYVYNPDLLPVIEEGWNNLYRSPAIYGILLRGVIWVLTLDWIF